jgi:hypothetical protein
MRIGPLLRRIPSKVLGYLVLISSLGALVIFYPFLSIEEGVSFNTGNPFATSFSVANEGIFTATDLSAKCSMSASFGVGNILSDVGTVHTDFAPALRYKHRQTIPCFTDTAFSAGSIKSGAMLRIAISYGIFGIPIHRPQSFNFEAERGAEGAYHWTYQN